jgi:hypothetical protein
VKHALLALTLLATLLTSCREKNPAVATAALTNAPAAWEYLEVDMDALDAKKFPKGITRQWYEISDYPVPYPLPKALADALGERGWELSSAQLSGKVVFKRRNTGQGKTQVTLRSQSAYE